MKVLAVAISIALLPWSGAFGSDPPMRTWPLPFVIKECPTIALVELTEIKVVASADPKDPDYSTISLQVRLIENWRGRFPQNCTVSAHLHRANHRELKAGDRAVLFVNKSVDLARTTAITEADLKYLDGGFLYVPLSPHNEYVVAERNQSGWFTARGIDYKDRTSMDDFRKTIYSTIREMALNADQHLKGEGDLLNDKVLQPLFLLHNDKARPWARWWVGYQLEKSMMAVQISPDVLYVVCNFLKDFENIPDRYTSMTLISYRKGIVMRLNEPKPGDQVPEYLRNLPKDDDEAIKQALERFLREYEKDKKNKQ